MQNNIGIKVIKVFRNIFAETPLQRLKITGKIYAFLAERSLNKYVNEDGNLSTVYKGVELEIPLSDKAIMPSIIGGYFESFELDILGAFAKKKSVFFDVGGNVGLFALVAAKANKDLKVFSFEPIADNVRIFSKNITSNQLTNIELEQLAVSDTGNDLELFISGSSSTHSASKKHSGGSESVTVLGTTVDKYAKKIRQKPDLLKIDVEGYDYYALLGSKNVLKNAPPLFIEYDPVALEECGSSANDFADMIYDRYPIVYIIDEKKRRLVEVTKDKLLMKTVRFNLNLLAVKHTDDRRVLENVN